jgi:hypothetical protein
MSVQNKTGVFAATTKHTKNLRHTGALEEPSDVFIPAITATDSGVLIDEMVAIRPSFDERVSRRLSSPVQDAAWTFDGLAGWTQLYSIQEDRKRPST